MLVKGRRAICEYVGEDRNLFTFLRKTENLPVWSRGKGGRWKARSKDLDKWIDQQTEKHLEGVI